ncbi:MAG: hypothetical protein ABJG78_21095 [Cyclobacteriaceae bacterium]
MSTEIYRKYNIPDGILLAHVGKVAETLPNDLSTFEAGFSMINQSFLDGLIADHENALEEGGDNVSKGQVGEKTQALVGEMEKSQKIIKQLRFWVNEAFGGNPAKRKAFNLTKFWKIAYSQSKLIQFMNSLQTIASENGQPLLDAGMNPQILTDLEDNAEALAEADAEQESSKGGRSSATQERIISLNLLFERSQKLDAIADILYEDNPAKRDFYSIPVISPKAEDLEDDEEEPEV